MDGGWMAGTAYRGSRDYSVSELLLWVVSIPYVRESVCVRVCLAWNYLDSFS